MSKVNIMNILKQHTVDCPECEVRLWFEGIGGMRVVRNHQYNSQCPSCKKERKVWAVGKRKQNLLG